ncbi:MAG: hypothetical protein E7575_00905 [Ruminococcaceae bacterium]|nr:hypothetical protein [Oscillospiraceae bacterium]
MQVIDLDEELLKLIAGVKNGRHEDFELLKARYRPLISDLAASFEESGAGTASELSEDAQRALLKAAVSFDETKKGITFGLYAKICMRNALISVMRSKNAKKNSARPAGPEKKDRIGNLSGFEGLEPDEIIEKIKSSLSPFETQVLCHFFSGESAAQTAGKLGCDEKSVYNAVYRIRSKAKALSNKTSDKNK